MEIISLNLMNYWRRIVLSVFIIEIFVSWLKLSIEMFKFLNWLSPQIMNDVFQVKSPATYYPRDKNELYSRNPKVVVYGTESVSFMAPKVWSIVPQELKNSQSLKIHVGYAKPICNMLVLYNNHVWYWNKNIFFLFIFYIFNYMLPNRCIFFFFYIFPHWYVDTDIETRWMVSWFITVINL